MNHALERLDALSARASRFTSAQPMTPAEAEARLDRLRRAVWSYAVAVTAAELSLPIGWRNLHHSAMQAHEAGYGDAARFMLGEAQRRFGVALEFTMEAELELIREH